MIGKGKITAATFDQVVLSVTSFIINILLIRYMSVNDFGIYVVVFSFLLLANGVHTALITAPISVIVSKLSDTDAILYIRKLNYGQYLLSIIISAVILIAALIIGEINEYEVYKASLISVAIASPFYLGQLYVKSILLSRLRIIDVLKNDILYTVLQLVFIVVMIDLGEITIVMAILALAFSSLIAFSYGLFQCKEYFRLIKVSFWSGVKENINHGQWLLGTTLLTWGRTNAINFISLYYVGPAAPAALRAAQTIFGPINLVLVSLESMVPQYCSKIYSSQGIISFVKILRKLSVIFLSGMLAYSFIVYMFTTEILDLLFGAEYFQYQIIVWILCIQYLFITFQTTNIMGLRVLNMPKFIFRAFVLESLITIAPGIYLIKIYGIEGAALWKLLSSVVVTFIVYYYYRVGRVR